jgi:hypothetical protein
MWAAKEGHMDIVAWLREYINSQKVKDDKQESVKAEAVIATKALMSWKSTSSSIA